MRILINCNEQIIAEFKSSCPELFQEGGYTRIDGSNYIIKGVIPVLISVKGSISCSLAVFVKPYNNIIPFDHD